MQRRNESPFAVLFCYLSLNMQLHFLRLPKDINTKNVILMDATVSSGAAGVLISKTYHHRYYSITEALIYLYLIFVFTCVWYVVAYRHVRSFCSRQTLTFVPAMMAVRILRVRISNVPTVNHTGPRRAT